MDPKKLILGAAVYTVCTFSLAVVWHVLLFKERYESFGYFEGEPNFLVGLFTIVLQGILLSTLFAMLKPTGSSLIGGSSSLLSPAPSSGPLMCWPSLPSRRCRECRRSSGWNRSIFCSSSACSGWSSAPSTVNGNRPDGASDKRGERGADGGHQPGAGQCVLASAIRVPEHVSIGMSEGRRRGAGIPEPPVPAGDRVGWLPAKIMRSCIMLVCIIVGGARAVRSGRHRCRDGSRGGRCANGDGASQVSPRDPAATRSSAPGTIPDSNLRSAFTESRHVISGR